MYAVGPRTHRTNCANGVEGCGVRYDNRLRRPPLTRRGPSAWRVLVCIALAVIAVWLVGHGYLIVACVAALWAVAAVR